MDWWMLGLALAALLALALQAGSGAGAVVAAAGAAPLLLGMLGGALREPRQKTVPRQVEARGERPVEPERAPSEERRAA